MQRCLELAANGIGKVAPNPMVGAVLVHDEVIIGEGWHQRFGGPHAEVHAIEEAQRNSPELLGAATLYVNLEPCSYHGKTPACTDLVLKHRIPRVITGCADPNPKVAGQGIELLQKAGCEVTAGVLEEQCRKLNKRFYTFHEQQRPYIILKWAQTQDGFMARTDRKREWISNLQSRKLVHKWRSEEMAILVGFQTALHDNPKLDTRDWPGSSPLRLLIDRELELPQSLHLFDQSIPTAVFTAREKASEDKLTYITIDFRKDIIPQILHYLYEQEIQSLFIEGGQQLLNSFIKAGLWDEARVFIGNKHFGEGIEAPEMTGSVVEATRIDDDRLLIYTP